MPAAGWIVDNWKLTVMQLLLDPVAITALDQTVSPPARLDVAQARLQLRLVAEQAGSGLQLKLANAAFSAADLTLASGAQTPFKLAQLGFTDGSFDLGVRRAGVGRLYAQGGQLQLTRDRKGELNLLALLPRFNASGRPAAAPAPSPSAPWVATANSVELDKFGADVHDEGSGVKVHVTDRP